MKRESPLAKLRQRSSRRPIFRKLPAIAPTDLLWALIGLILTIGGTFLEASITNPPWSWGHEGLLPQSLGVTYQVGAVLLIACLGGRNAAVISQVAYLLLGLTSWFNIFTYDSGLDYVHRPSFGYLLGFIPGAWLCGTLAFRLPVRLESLAFSCLCGLLTVHLVGLGYLAIAYNAHWLMQPTPPALELVSMNSLYPLPGQLAVVCVVTVIAFILRHLLFY